MTQNRALTSGVAEVHVDGTRQDLHDFTRTSNGGRKANTMVRIFSSASSLRETTA